MNRSIMLYKMFFFGMGILGILTAIILYQDSHVLVSLILFIGSFVFFYDAFRNPPPENGEDVQEENKEVQESVD